MAPVRHARTLVLAALFLVGYAGAPALAQDGQRVLSEIVKVNSATEVVIGAGTSKGVKERMVFDVYNPAKVITLPMTKEVAYTREVVVAQVVILAAEGQTSVGRVVAVGGGTKNVPAMREGAKVVSNPYAASINLPPHIEKVSTSPSRVAFGTPLTLSVTARDEPHDQVFFTWSADGGLLSHARSSTPQVVWTPPAAPGTHTITITAIDTAGNRTARAVKITNPGFKEFSGNVYAFKRTLG
ncbi:MAG: PKD domain-containing protein, partial [Planctomycetota bacterium]